MFTVETERYLIKVKFMHFWTNRNNLKKRRFHTKCSIKVIDKNTKEEIYHGEEISTCNPLDYLKNDVPNKNVGKKIALSKLISPTYYPESGNIYEPYLYGYLTKEERTLIWNKFLETFPLFKNVDFVVKFVYNPPVA